MLSTYLDWSLANTKWANELNPILKNPMTNMQLIPNVVLATGTNLINHGLGRLQQGWVITDIQGAQTIYRNAAFTETTLSLSSSGAVTISLAVF